MKCFYHSDRDAVAVCKSCHRGLCPECSVEVPPGLGCRGRCEAELAALNRVLQESKSAHARNLAAYRRNAVALFVIGLLFVGFGIFPVLVSRAYHALLLVPFGCVFLLWAFLSYRSVDQICGGD